ncbi:glycosyl hydrolase family 28-related protein [Staphylococcus chromogenes]|uniref:glycosyl hydrolase family 28-related protein n=1 Tax=Staphylococcus chromogenes TaxID=46126 RepID=UPI000D04537C|nr:glycosyl hydrolase family 28-related protein [Staphylococcus chromogenes]MDT0656215.1 glycosyl hydrolase family 28-related protein [Staphylococcus chromogenes]MDT0698950.1 glycosyl hydrolase family 28-related protein [Staphylococcus chromogenes]MDT0716629.1 glycosyl hydrolase family 28-related protein [Staphylococcus chromogenes]MDT0736436.1 glycosyl hydrolase family 28-related protein [Staphylococcus chromogenes]MDT0748426.1 glycosyl hydrolase family 28-related protein [Staphylococcus chro
MFKNVKDFGAKTKNKWKDTIGIQRALTKVAQHGGGTVFIPKGEYHIAKALKIYHNTKLKLDPEAILLRKGKDALLKNGSSRKKYYRYEGNGHIKIEGGTFDMNGNEYPYNNTAMCLGHAREVEVAHVTFKNIVGGHGIDACGLDGVHIHDCQFLGFADYVGDRSFSEAIQLDLFVEGAFPKFGINDGTITKNVVIERCYFGNSGEGAMGPWNRAIGSHASRLFHFYENIVIQDNVFEATKDYALTPLKAKNVYIVNNTFKNCAGALRYLGVYKGKNMYSFDGRIEGKEGGKGLIFMNNRVENVSHQDTLHIRSHKEAPHQHIEILNNVFIGTMSPIQLTAIDHVALFKNENLPELRQQSVNDLRCDA